MLGGNIPGVTRTLSLVIYDDVQQLNYAHAHRTAALLLFVSLVTLILLHYLSARKLTR
jgi:molybdate transport system permease protein